MNINVPEKGEFLRPGIYFSGLKMCFPRPKPQNYALVCPSSTPGLQVTLTLAPNITGRAYLPASHCCQCFSQFISVSQCGWGLDGEGVGCPSQGLILSASLESDQNLFNSFLCPPSLFRCLGFLPFLLILSLDLFLRVYSQLKV